MIQKSSLLLLGLALGVAGFVFLWEGKQPGTDERRRNAERLLGGIASGDVDRVSVKTATGEWSARRQGDEWKLEKPWSAKGDMAAIEAWIGELIGIRRLESLGESELKGGTADVGLIKGTQIEIGGKGFDRTITVGTVDLPGARRCVQFSSEPGVTLVDAAIGPLLSRDAEQFRDHALFAARESDITRLEIHRGGSLTLALERRADRWWLKSPLDDLADSTLASGLAQRLLSLRVDRFELNGPTQLPGAASPWFTVTIQRANPDSTESLTVGDPAGDEGRRWGIGGGFSEPFKIQVGSLDPDLTRAAEAWRSKLAIETTVYDLQHLSLSRGDQTLELERSKEESGSSWKVLAPTGFQLDATKLGALLDKLGRLEAQGLAPAGTTLGAVSAKVVMRHSDPKQSPDVVLTIGSKTERGSYIASTLERSTLLELDAASVEQIDPSRLRADQQ